MHRCFHLLQILGLTADLQGHQASLFQNTEIHVHAFRNAKLLAQLGDEAAASPFPQQCRGEIGTHHPGLIVGGGSAPEHQQTR